MPKINQRTFLNLLIILSSFLNQTEAFTQLRVAQSETNSTDYEKLFLHTDRSNYHAGEDIWFKAYLVNAKNYQFANQSQIVYVELITSDSVILQHRTVEMSNGTGHGDFQLSDSVQPGLYQLRAYTRYMQNFDAHFFFTKTLQIENLLLPEDSVHALKSVEPAIDIQFFPEGGSLVEGIESRVAFKSVNAAGKGCAVSGAIFNYYGDSVTVFKSAHLGMGSFYFTPKKGTAYFTKGVAENGVEFEIELPRALDSGVVMNVKVNPRNLFITVNSNANSKLRLEGALQDDKFLETSLDPNIPYYTIPFDDLPEGILRLTIYNEKNLPLCERLVFVPQNQIVEIVVKTDKELYKQREEVALEVAVKNSNDWPEDAELSLAVVDENFLQNVEPFSSNIASWYLLESEIRGEVEQPAYYFDPAQPDRLNHLDLLLLTQGWRDFRWKYLPKGDQPMLWQPEEGFTIQGKLRNRFINKPIPGADIRLGISDNDVFVMNITNTDSQGNFVFKGLHFTGENNMKLKVVDDKLKLKSMILYDTLKYRYPKIQLSPVLKEENKRQLQKPLAREEENQKQNNKNIVMLRYRLRDTIAIDEVVVEVDRAHIEEVEFMTKEYGTPDFVVKADNSYRDIYELLDSRFAGVQVEYIGGNKLITIRGQGVMYLLDGVKVDKGYIEMIPMEEIEQVNIIKNATIALYGMNSMGSFGGIISVVRKPFGSVKYDVYHTIDTKIQGYDEARVFFVPDYSNKQPEHEKPDLRTTVYWKPDIHIKDSNPVNLKYYNADIPAKLIIKVQGITYSGVPVTGQASYLVE